jgi:hypothetical protein
VKPTQNLNDLEKEQEKNKDRLSYDNSSDSGLPKSPKSRDPLAIGVFFVLIFALIVSSFFIIKNVKIYLDKQVPSELNKTKKISPETYIKQWIKGVYDRGIAELKRVGAEKKKGVVLDETAGLEWYAGPDRDTNWRQAKYWVENLKVAGGGWRMPTRYELQTLYQKDAGTRNMTPLLKTTGWWVWSGETGGSSSAWYFGFGLGNGHWNDRDDSHNTRGFAVRSRR